MVISGYVFGIGFLFGLAAALLGFLLIVGAVADTPIIVGSGIVLAGLACLIPARATGG